MAKDAYSILLPLLLVTVLSLFFGYRWIGLVFLLLAGFIVYFFRDPQRNIPADPSTIVSPADGKIVRMVSAADGTTQISIFLSIFNVHINRAPMEGRVENVEYRPGKFRAAFRESASLENEQNILVISNSRSRIRFSQIAGVLARRVVCWKKAGDVVMKGERIGLIKFGSRVDVFLPNDARPAVSLGEKVRGGTSVIGRFSHA